MWHIDSSHFSIQSILVTAQYPPSTYFLGCRVREGRMPLERLQGRQWGEGMRLHCTGSVTTDWTVTEQSRFLITPVVLNTVIKGEACVKGFGYWLHTSPAFFVCFPLFLLSACTTSFLFLHLCSVGLCHLVAKGTEKGEWKRPVFMGREGLGEFSAQIWTVSDLQ